MKKIFLSITFFCFLVLFLLPYSFAIEKSNYPPVSPSWVFDHWVWEDDENTEEALWEMINGYEKHNIPVGAVIIDSPWATEYNNFIFDTTKYPNPKEMIDKLHQRGIKVILWVTVMLNKENNDAPGEPKTNEIYKEAKEKGYLINNGETFGWWKGKGAYLDFTNPEAVEWWHGLQDRVLDLGIDGWKVDEVGITFPLVGYGKNKKISRLKYKDAYYIDFYEYILSKNPKGITLVRSVDFFPFAPISHAPATWVGDQKHNWGKDGFLEALSHIFDAANLGYAVIGSDTAGYHGDEEITKELLIRWAQFSAFCTLFQNGGHGKHEPWLFDQETVDIYRYYVKLHLELKPYFYSLMMRSHLKQGNVFIADKDNWQLKIGDFILVSVIFENKNVRKVFLPEGNWLDYWTGEIRRGPSEFDYEVPLSQYPIFLKEGSIIPLEVVDDTCGNGGVWSKNADTFLIVPGVSSSFTLYGEEREPALIKMESTPSKISLSCEKTGRPKIFLLKNIKEVKEIKGDGIIYRKVKKLKEFAKKDFAFYYDKFRKTLFIKSNQTNALDLQVLLKEGEKEDLSASQETTLGNFIADAVRSEMSAEIALVPASALNYGLPAGEITKDYFSNFSPFNDDLLVLLNLKGKQIKEAMEFSLRAYPKESKNFLQISGMKLKFDPTKKSGERVVEINLINSEGKEEPLSDDKIYKVATLRFLALGEMGYFKVFNEKDIIKFSRETYLEVIINYLKKIETLNISGEDKKERIKVLKTSEETREY